MARKLLLSLGAAALVAAAALAGADAVRGRALAALPFGGRPAELAATRAAAVVAPRSPQVVRVFVAERGGRAARVVLDPRGELAGVRAAVVRAGRVVYRGPLAAVPVGMLAAGGSSVLTLRLEGRGRVTIGVTATGA